MIGRGQDLARRPHLPSLIGPRIRRYAIPRGCAPRQIYLPTANPGLLQLRVKEFPRVLLAVRVAPDGVGEGSAERTKARGPRLALRGIREDFTAHVEPRPQGRQIRFGLNADLEVERLEPTIGVTYRRYGCSQLLILLMVCGLET